jgi:hypothetical protein
LRRDDDVPSGGGCDNFACVPPRVQCADNQLRI